MLDDKIGIDIIEELKELIITKAEKDEISQYLNAKTEDDKVTNDRLLGDFTKQLKVLTKKFTEEINLIRTDLNEKLQSKVDNHALLDITTKMSK